MEREYRRALNSRFIHARNRSEYPVQEKNPKGEIHAHEEWFSEFEEIFELAEPGKAFELYSRAWLKRVK